MKRHYPRWAYLATWLAFPAYIWQGIGVRLKSDRLLPPAGEPEGIFVGKGAPIKLLVLGDSSVVGIGVDVIEDGMAWQLANALQEKTGRTIVWRAAGFNSAIAADIRDHAVPLIEPDDWTHIVLSIGVNDTKNFHSLGRFKREFGTLLYALKARFPMATILWSPMVDMRHVPALPDLLALILAVRADAFNVKGAQLCAERGVGFADPLPVDDPGGFSRDGFHAGTEGYKAWADHLVPHLTGN